MSLSEDRCEGRSDHCGRRPVRPRILLSVTRPTKNWFTISPTAVAYQTTCVCIILNNNTEIAVGPIRVSFRLLYKTIPKAKAGDLFLIKRDSSKPKSTPWSSRVASKQCAFRPMAPRTWINNSFHRLRLKGTAGNVPPKCNSVQRLTHLTTFVKRR